MQPIKSIATRRAARAGSNIENLARVTFAAAWTLAWGTFRFIDGCLESPDSTITAIWFLAWHWGRRASPKPMVCTLCGWGGPERWAVHTYCGGEAVDECPRCGDQDSLRGIGPS